MLLFVLLLYFHAVVVNIFSHCRFADSAVSPAERCYKPVSFGSFETRACVIQVACRARSSVLLPAAAVGYARCVIALL